MNGFNIKPADLIFEKIYGLSTALLSANFSIHYNNNIFYIISYTNKSNVLQITSIDITDIDNPIIKQVSNTYSNVKFYVNTYEEDKTYINVNSGYNKLPFSYPYVYVQSYNNNYTFYKININDSTDVSVLETEITDSKELSYGWSKFSDRFMLHTGYTREDGYAIIDIVSNKIYDSTYAIDGEPSSMRKYNVFLANNIDNSPYMIYEGNASPAARIIKNLWALFTINNLTTAITKTSDQTMKITYTLSEQE